MENHSSKLEQLRIDRGQTSAGAILRKHSIRKISLAVLVLAVASWAIVILARNPSRQIHSPSLPAPAANTTNSVLENHSERTLLDASGYVVARRRATVSSKITGRIAEVRLQEGESVVEGEIIAKLDDANAKAIMHRRAAEVRRADAVMNAATLARRNGEQIYTRARQQLERQLISVQDYEIAKASYDSLVFDEVVAREEKVVAEAALIEAKILVEDTIIRAPFSGVLLAITAQPGEVVSPVSGGGGFTRTGIGTIVDMNSLEVEVEVHENYIESVWISQPAEIVINALSSSVISSHVIGIVPTADRSTATVRVRLSLPQNALTVLPDMSARARLFSEGQEP